VERKAKREFYATESEEPERPAEIRERERRKFCLKEKP